MINDNGQRMPSWRAWRATWPQWIGYLAAGWSLAYGGLGLFWALGGRGFPFGTEHDRGAMASILGGVSRATGAPVIAWLGALGAALALVMARGWGRGAVRVGLLTLATLTAVALLVVIPDQRVLVAIAYAPIFLVGAPFHFPPVNFTEAIPWPVLNQGLIMLGGALWAATALAYRRVTAGACTRCGRTDQPGSWATPDAATRWGRWAIAVAVICPVLYALTRYAWLLGIPLGISETFLREGQHTGLWVAGAGLATVALGGAILTLGLAQRWGEVFPRWMLGLAGKRVPPALAIAPALVVAVIITSAGIGELRALAVNRGGSIEASWSTVGPTLLWPLWGAALAAAAWAYALRRRGRCASCGRG